MKNLVKMLCLMALPAFLLMGCSKDVWNGIFEDLGMKKSNVDYSMCKKYEDRARDNNLSQAMREQAFKDLSQCRETAKALQESKDNEDKKK